MNHHSQKLATVVLAAYVSGKLQVTISLAFKDQDGKAGTYVQTLRINEVAGSSFGGEFSTPGKTKTARASGTIQRDTFSLDARWERGAKCSWTARIDEQGVLPGRPDAVRALRRQEGHIQPGRRRFGFVLTIPIDSYLEETVR